MQKTFFIFILKSYITPSTKKTINGKIKVIEKNITNSKKWNKNTNIGLALLISIITFLVYKAIGYNTNCEIKNGNNDIQSGNFIFLFLFNLLLLSKISILYFKYFFNKKFFLNQLIKLHTTIKLNMSWFFGNKNYCLSFFKRLKLQPSKELAKTLIKKRV